MSTLPNSKHERFAQALADGKSAADAYVLAGYKPNRGNAIRLKANESITRRVREILAERERFHGQVTAKAIEQAGVTKAWVISRLIEIANRTMQHTPVLDAGGKPILVDLPDGARSAVYKFDPKAATRAVELLGQELGMFIKRQEVGKPGEFSHLDDETLNQKIYDELVNAGVSPRIARAFAGATAAD